MPILIGFLFWSAGAQGQNSAEVILAGYKQVPRVPTPATGMAEVTLKSDTLIVDGNFSDLREPYRSAAIFYGEEGEQGNQLFTLNPSLNEDKTSGSFSGNDNRFTLGGEIRKALSEGNLYIAITSSKYPRGEIRGQIPPIK
ncbi:MAG: CHRD domain-containing protein [Balneolaceae bacterium]